MSHNYRLTFNLMGGDLDTALAAVMDAERAAEDRRCIVNNVYAETFGGGVYGGRVYFTAASDVEADGIATAVKALPGLPPMDAVKWKRVGR